MHNSFFLENSFQKHKILTSLEAILERFVFKILKFRALKMELLKLYNMVFIKVLVYLSSATCTMNLQNPKNGCKLPSRDFANPPNRYRKSYPKKPQKMNIKLTSLLFLATFYSCKSQKNVQNFLIDDDGITVEKLDKSKTYDQNYNDNNKIFVIGKSYKYSYYYEGLNEKKYLITKGKEIQNDNYKIFDWDFIEFERQNSETIKSIILIANLGNPFEKDIPEYNQTSISYQYLKNNGEFFTMEVTGAIENEKNVWIHPPRSNFFKILELNPFPYIQSPYQIGTKWNWKLNIGDHWSDKRWMEWKGGIENAYDYEIIDKKNIETKLGNFECFIIKSKAKSRIGETELTSYFNEKYGFVKLEYKNIDGTKTILELEKVE